MFIGEAIGPFKIERELGSGAMGTVYRAEFQKDDETVKTVALKIVALGLLGNEGAMARFEREANILKQLRHPNIVRLIATGRYKKTPFIAMEFVDGEPLDRMQARRGRLGWEEVAGYMKQLCLALQSAHDKGIIHRDLKPSNLMITREGVLKLTDFGIAKDQDVTALTGANSTIGTAAYMSPEQCKGDRNLSGKSDLYSLGVVMYELITGRKPFVAETTVDMFLKHVHEKPVRPTRLVQDLPVWLETLMLHLLEKDKDKRPLDAATVGRMLEEIETKVAAHQSAGEAAAKARRIDRPLTDAALDSTDIEAARTLRDSREGKRRKKKKPAAALPWRLPKFLLPGAGLAVIVAVVYFAFRPESIEKQFAKIEAATSIDDKISEAKKFLERHGADGGETVEKAKSILRESRGRKAEAVLEKRFYSDGGFRKIRDNEDDEAYSSAWAAMEAEEGGDLVRAAQQWEKVKIRGATAKDDYADGWAWLGEHRMAEIKRVLEHVNTMEKELKDFQINESPWKFEPDDPKSLALKAVRLGGAGGPPPIAIDESFKPLPILRDEAKIARTWSDLSEMTRKKTEQRSWHLLANRESKTLGKINPGEALDKRKAAMKAQLEQISTRWKRAAGDPNLGTVQRDCRNRTRDIVELFADETDPDCRKYVDEAKALLAEMTKK